MVRQDCVCEGGVCSNFYDDIIGKIIVELEEGWFFWVQFWGIVVKVLFVML